MNLLLLALLSAPVLYGGASPDAQTREEAVAAVEEAGLDATAAAWMFDGDLPSLGMAKLVGEGELTPCSDGALSFDGFLNHLNEGLLYWDQMDAPAAIEHLDEAWEMLPCLDGFPSSAELRRLGFGRALARFYEGGLEADQRAATAFTDLHRVDPDAPWNDDYPAEPRAVFYESRDGIRRQGLTYLVSTLPPGVLRVDGRAPTPWSVLELLPGPHLIQVQDGNTAVGGWLRLEPGQLGALGRPEDLTQAFDTMESTPGGAQDRVRRALLALQDAVLFYRGDGLLLRVDPATGMVHQIEAPKPPPQRRINLELGAGYALYDTHAIFGNSLPPHRLSVELGGELTLTPALSLGADLGALLGDRRTTPSGDSILDILPTLRGWATLAPAKGQLQPGLRVFATLLLFPNEDLELQGGLLLRHWKVRGGGGASFVLHLGRGVAGALLELGGGWAGAPFARMNLKLVLRPRWAAALGVEKRHEGSGDAS